MVILNREPYVCSIPILDTCILEKVYKYLLSFYYLHLDRGRLKTARQQREDRSFATNILIVIKNN